MITIEEKLKVFTKLVLEKVQNEYDEKSQEIRAYNDGIIEKEKERLIDKSNTVVEELRKKGEIEKNRIISKTNLDSKKKILNKKEELLNKLIENLEKKGKQFTYEEEYESFFKTILDKVLEALKEKGAIVLFVSDKDKMKYSESIEKECKNKGLEEVEIKILDSEFIGGVIGIDKEETIKIDYSIKSIIDENRSLIGQMLYEKL